jgi:phage RecT family recombinase
VPNLPRGLERALLPREDRIVTEVLSTELERAAQPQEVRTVLDLIDSMKPELMKSLQSESAAEILIRHYYSAIRFNPLLRQCTAESLVGAMLLTAQCRLEPGPLGHVYLVPFKVKGAFEVIFMLGYTGIIELGRRGGAVGLRSSVVWDCDEYTAPWENEKGLHYQLVPGAPEKRVERVGVLVTWKESRGSGQGGPGRPLGGERQALHCPPSRIDTALKASPMKDASRREEDWYWRKTGVRFARPWLPLTTELATADRSDDAIVTGVDEGQPTLTEAGGET